MKRKRPFTRGAYKSAISYGGGVYKRYKGVRRYAPRLGNAAARARRARAFQALNIRTGGLLGVEYKFIDSTLGATAITNTMTVHDPAGNGCLTFPAMGDSASQRDGRVIRVKQIYIRGHVYRIDTAAVAASRDSSTVRLVLVQDMQTNAAQAAGATVFTTVGSPVHAFRNMDYRQRFRVLWDHTFMLYDVCAFNDAAATGAVNGITNPFKIIKNVDIPVHFIGDDGAVASVTDNSFHLYACTSTATANLDYMTYACRIRFVG